MPSSANGRLDGRRINYDRSRHRRRWVKTGLRCADPPQGLSMLRGVAARVRARGQIEAASEVTRVSSRHVTSLSEHGVAPRRNISMIKSARRFV